MKNFYLKQKFPNQDFNHISEKDIIFMSRTCLAKRDINYHYYEKEILEIIQSKNWNWEEKDIDGCNLLTYPIYNQAFNIVNYLINEKKYDLSLYRKDISTALSASIMLNGMMLEKLLTYSLHQDYPYELLKKVYSFILIMTHNENDEYRNIYLKHSKTILSTMNQPDYKRILKDMMEISEDKYNLAYLVIYFLENMEIKETDKLKYIEELKEESTMQNNKRMWSDLEKWKLAEQLKRELVIYSGMKIVKV